MSNKSNHIGYCRICNKYDTLTFEHIPPKCAFNNTEARIYTGDSFMKLMCDKNRYPWEREGIKYKQLQKGMGDFTLCKNCNNITGKLYGEEYKKWVYIAIKSINKNSEIHKNANHAILKLKNVYPGRFIRQVLSIICSTYPGFTQKYPYVKRIILDKDYKFQEEPDFKIYMYLLKNPYNGYSGISGIILSDWTIKLIDEIDLYPFGFYLSLSDITENEMNITEFLKCGYNTVAEVDLTMNLHEKNSVMPMDFRTKKEIIDASITNKGI